MSYDYTAGDLAREMAKPGFEGGTYTVLIAPSCAEGVRFSAYPFPPSGRFIVGGGAADGARVFPADLSQRPGDRGVGAVYRALLAMAKRAAVIGAWRDAQGRLWLDEVDAYAHPAEAFNVARARGELAIWDGKESREHSVTGEAAEFWAEYERELHD